MKVLDFDLAREGWCRGIRATGMSSWRRPNPLFRRLSLSTRIMGSLDRAARNLIE